MGEQNGKKKKGSVCKKLNCNHFYIWKAIISQCQTSMMTRTLRQSSLSQHKLVQNFRWVHFCSYQNIYIFKSNITIITSSTNSGSIVAFSFHQQHTFFCLSLYLLPAIQTQNKSSFLSIVFFRARGYWLRLLLWSQKQWLFLKLFSNLMAHKQQLE